jgi:type I restriction enzyme S subunit
MIIRIQDLTGSGSNPNRFAGVAEPRHEVKHGDLLISWAATLGVFWWKGEDAVLNQHIFKVESFIDKRFHYYLAGHVITDLYRQAHGSGMVHITKSLFEGTPVIVPPIAEQRRIVIAIEEHLSRLDAAVVSLKRVLALIPRFHDAVLRTAVTGDLAEGDAAEWVTTDLGSVADIGTGATPFRSNAVYWENGTVPWVTSGQLNSPVVTSASEFVSERALAETNLTIYPPGTLLLAMYGEGRTRGKCAELQIASTTNQAIAAIQLRDGSEVLRAWVKIVLGAMYAQLRRAAVGGVQPNLNLSIVRAIRLPLPPRAEQARIVAEVDLQMSMAGAAETSVVAMLGRVRALRGLILQRAFEGKLVPQDPRDEPASVPVDRIRAARISPDPRRTRAPRRT